MGGIFLNLLNISITAGWLISAVILLRFLLKKAPKSVNFILWALVALRLIFPFSIESALSLIPSAEPVHESSYSSRDLIQARRFPIIIEVNKEK